MNRLYNRIKIVLCYVKIIFFPFTEQHESPCNLRKTLRRQRIATGFPVRNEPERRVYIIAINYNPSSSRYLKIIFESCERRHHRPSSSTLHPVLNNIILKKKISTFCTSRSPDPKSTHNRHNRRGSEFAFLSRRLSIM